MTKLAILSDSHLSPDNTELIENLFNEFCTYCVKNKINTAWHIGDFFEQRFGQPLNVLKSAKRILKLFTENNIHLNIVVGNHDKPNYDLEDSFLDLFSDYKMVTIHNDFKTIENEGYSVTTMPYFSTKIFNEKAKSISRPKNDFNVCMVHQGIDGAVNQSYVVENSISEKTFDKFDLTLCGHYHNRHFIGDNIFYIGSIRPKDFGEDEEKGFIVLDNKTKNIQTVPLTFKQYHTIHIYSNMNEDIFKRNIKSAKSLVKKHFVRVMFEGDKSFFTEHRNDLENLGIKTVYKNSNSSIPNTYTNISLKKGDKNSLLNEFEKFCKKEKYDFEFGKQFIK